MLLKDFIQASTHELTALYPPEEARAVVSRLCCERLGVESYTHIIEPGREIPAPELSGLKEDMAHLLAHEPLQYVLGYADFCSRRFKVCRDVLIPRPETEQLVALAEDWLRSQEKPQLRAIDLCTGSGCIAWTLALDLPSLSVTATDISDAALRVARSQFAPFPGHAPAFVKADVLQAAPAALRSGPPYDLIVSNPPYIRESEKAAMRRNVLDYEPASALFVSDSDPLLFYRACADRADELLRSGGAIVLEINEALGRELAAIFEGRGYTCVKIIPDFFGKDRFLSALKR